MAPHRVIAVRYQTPDLFELTLARNGLVFESGDCLALACPAGDSRPYSIASGRDEEDLRFYIRRLSGGAVSAWLGTLQPGQNLEASPPFGWFRPAADSASAHPRIFVATGTGIAPFLSALHSEPACRPLAVLYGVRQLADALELAYLAERCPLQLAISRENAPPHHRGRVTDLLASLPHPSDTHYYLCGLDAMVNDVNAWLDARDIPHTHIHREIFFAA